MSAPPNLMEDVARFWSYVEKGDACWTWTGELNSMGYGRFSFYHDGQRTRVLAHRLSAILAGFPPAEGQVVRHACDNPVCVNPAHLLNGTQRDNMHDAIRRGRANTSGLEMGWRMVVPPRPCRRCKAATTTGRRWYCPPCKKEANREYQETYKAKRRVA